MNPEGQNFRYRNPPIKEAVCEMGFKPGQEWDLTIPGKLQSELGSEYTGKPQEQRVIGFGLEQREDSPPNIQFGEGLAKVQLVTDNGSRMVGVGSDVLSVHMLRPYHCKPYPKASGWSEFYSRINTALDAYWKVAMPIGINRIGLRYINTFNIPIKTDLDTYLACAFSKVDGLPDDLINFISRGEYLYQDNIRLALSQGSIGKQVDQVSLLLDLDVMWEDHDNPVTKTQALSIARELHDREKEAFEAVITPKARELFNAD